MMTVEPYQLALPERWETVPLKFLATVETGTGDTQDADPDGTFPFIVRSPDPLVSSSYSYDTEAVLTAGDGNVGEIFHHMRGKFHAHQRVYILHDFYRIVPRYFYYFFSTFFQYMAKGGEARTTVDSVRRWMLTDMPFAVPPLDEQQAIADYLDRETKRIDELIAEQRGLIETLRERRDAGWASLYEAAMSAGRMVQIRRVLESIVDGPFGSSLTSAHYSDEGARVIRLGNIGVNKFRDEDQAFIPLDYAAKLSYHAAQPGDVVIAGLGDEKWPLGRATVLPDIGPAIVKADCYRVRPNGSVTAGYLAWALSAPASRRQISLVARGATRARLNTSVVREITIPVPSVEEQVRIVKKGKEEDSSIDALIAGSEDLIAFSQERRAALITAAVTGQIDVRTAV